MSYRRPANYVRPASVPRGVATKYGGRAVGTVAPDVVIAVPVVEPEYLSMSIYGVCSGCGVTSEDMERDGWGTADDYATCLCPSCRVGEKCSQCGLTMRVTKTQPGSEHSTRSYFRVGEFVAECTNPDCCDRGYLHRVDMPEVK